MLKRYKSAKIIPNMPIFSYLLVLFKDFQGQDGHAYI